MLTVYTIPPSLYCAKLRIVLRHKGLEWREVAPPGGYGSDEYKKIVPSGNLPALVDGGLLIADSEVIAEYLEERYPSPPMLDSDAANRAKVRERGRFHDTRLEPVLRSTFDYLPGRNRPTDEWSNLTATDITKRLFQLGRMLEEGPAVGERLQLGDCGYPITFAWLDALSPLMGLDIDWPKSVLAYRHHLSKVQAVADELADYEPKLAAFLSG